MGIKKIVIAGTGYLDVIQVIDEINKFSENKLELLGFLDDCSENYKRNLYGHKILGGFDWIQNNHTEVYVFNSIARTTTIRSGAMDRLLNFGAKFCNVIHPSVNINYVQIGSGVYIGKNAYLELGCKIESHVMILENATIAHDSLIGENSFVGAGVHIQGNVNIGDMCFIASGAVIYPGLTIENHSTIGINAAQVINVRAGESYAAAPARRINL